MGKEFLRQSTCNQCRHGRAVGVNYQRAYCEKTKREGAAERACCCDMFEYRLEQSDSLLSPKGFKYRSKQIEDYRTRRQWEDAGYKPKAGEAGHEMHSSMMTEKTYIYYLPDEVEPMTGNEEICANCEFYSSRWCDVAGDYVRTNGRCSEWSKRGT